MVIAGWLLLAGTAAAGHITLQVDTTTRVVDDRVLCTISIINRGDEAATEVQAHLELAGQLAASPLLPRLPASASKTWTAQLDGAGLGQGRHPILISVHYADTNNYPFTALAHAVCVRGSDLEPKMSVEARELEISSQGKVRLTINNPLPNPQQANVRLALPRELAATTATRQVEIGGGEQVKINFAISNKSALPGSAYQALALITTTDRERSTFVVANVPIRVLASSSFVKRYRLALLIAVVILVIGFFAAQLRRSPSHRSPQ